MNFDSLSSKWSVSGGAERANKDAFLLDLCDALGVPRPDPTTDDRARDGEEGPAEAASATQKAKWPATLTERIAAVQAAVQRAAAPGSLDDVARAFVKAPRKDVSEILDSLAAYRLALGYDTANGRRWRAVSRSAA